jgi:putative pyrimidine permease RutG
MISWREKREGIVAPDERLPWPATVAMGLQHVLAMFGATVVVPLIMGFDTNLAILFSGVGTLLFFIVTGGRVPSYLGSSFAFLGPVGVIVGSKAAGTFSPGAIPAALCGIIAAGLLYTLIGGLVQVTGSGWIDRLMPPLVTGAVVMIIGLNLAPAARNLSKDSPLLTFVTLLAILAIGLWGRGLVSRLAILLGTVVGYVVALVLGGTTPTGTAYGAIVVQGADLGSVASAAWIGLPNFVGPAFDWRAIVLVAPAAIVLVAENTGHLKAVEAMTGRPMMPYLGRAFAGDGIATMVAGFFGGTGVTTYAENIGVMAMTRVYSTILFVVAACVAILLGFSPKFGALVGSIPTGVIGGVATALFGLIAITGARIWVENRVDFTKAANLFVASVVLIVGAADYTIRLGDFELAGIGIGTFGAIILYQLVRLAPGGADLDAPADAAVSTRTERLGGGVSPRVPGTGGGQNSRRSGNRRRRG